LACVVAGVLGVTINLYSGSLAEATIRRVRVPNQIQRPPLPLFQRGPAS